MKKRLRKNRLQNLSGYRLERRLKKWSENGTKVAENEDAGERGQLWKEKREGETSLPRSVETIRMHLIRIRQLLSAYSTKTSSSFSAVFTTRRYYGGRRRRARVSWFSWANYRLFPPATEVQQTDTCFGAARASQLISHRITLSHCRTFYHVVRHFSVRLSYHHYYTNHKLQTITTENCHPHQHNNSNYIYKLITLTGED